MEELQSVIRYVVVIVAAVAAMLLGDYLGYKVGRRKLVWACIGVALLSNHRLCGICLGGSV